MFAVVKTGGKQYRVVAEDVLKVERIVGEPGDYVELTDILMAGEGEDVKIGAPLLDGALVQAEIVEQGRNRKIIAFKKRRRQNSRRKIGHRQEFSKLRIAEIVTDGKKPSKKTSTVSAEATTETDLNTGKKAAKTETDGGKNVNATQKVEKPSKEKQTEAAEKIGAAAPMFTAPEGAGDGDKLTTIKGIGPVAEKQLKEQGIVTFKQLAELTDDQVVQIDEAMPFSADQIKDWREQAKSK